MHVLSSLGWSDRWQALLTSTAPSAQPGRVVRADRGVVTVRTTDGDIRLAVPDNLYPVAGDWVAVDQPEASSNHQPALRLAAILHRSTTLTRPRPLTDTPQALAANVDLVGVTVALDQEVHPRRLERGLVLAWEAGATPIVLLTKADMVGDVAAATRTAARHAPATDIIAVSTVTGLGLDELRTLVAPDRTICMLGASGAGKSSLVNALVGDAVLDVGEVRSSDRRGRHTTTHRELVALPTGGAMLDTPGLRALGVGDAQHGIALAFPEIDELAERCRFADCGHDVEPGCAVLSARDDGTLSPDRYEGWRRVRAEAANAALRADKAAWRSETRRWGRVGREARRMRQGADRG